MTGVLKRRGIENFYARELERAPQNCAGLAQRLRQLSPIVVELRPGTSLRVGLSLGVASAEPGEAFEAVLARTDVAMYEDKRRQKLASEALS